VGVGDGRGWKGLSRASGTNFKNGRVEREYYHITPFAELLSPKVSSKKKKKTDPRQPKNKLIANTHRWTLYYIDMDLMRGDDNKKTNLLNLMDTMTQELQEIAIIDEHLERASFSPPPLHIYLEDVPPSPGSPASTLDYTAGSALDIFLVMTSAQVGQVILLLPSAICLMSSVPYGLTLQVFCTVTTFYTGWLLNCLYCEYVGIPEDFRGSLEGKQNSEHDEDDNMSLGSFNSGVSSLGSSNSRRRSSIIRHKKLQPRPVIQYHEVLSKLISPIFGTITKYLNVVCLIGLCVAQYVATATNLYIVDAGESEDPWSKRTWTGVTFVAYSMMMFVEVRERSGRQVVRSSGRQARLFQVF